MINNSAIGPRAILGEEGKGSVPVEKLHVLELGARKRQKRHYSDSRLYAIGVHFRYYVVVVLDCFLIHWSVPKGKEPGPGEAGAESWKQSVIASPSNQ